MTNQNDTDPQSPRARASRTDPGSGGAPPSGPRSVPFGDEPPRVKPLTPLPSPSSIETLLDGITGPRPPTSKTTPGVFASEIRATPLPRHAPVLAGVERAQDTTVYTARRAMVRNTLAVIVSGAFVALLLVFVVRWSDVRHSSSSPPKVEGVTASAPPREDPLPPAPVAPPVPAAPAPPAPVAAASTASTASGSASPAVAAKLPPPPRKPAGRATDAKKPAAHAEDLDDLNRQIRH
jgi:hypothetical protein